MFIIFPKRHKENICNKCGKTIQGEYCAFCTPKGIEQTGYSDWRDINGYMHRVPDRNKKEMILDTSKIFDSSYYQNFKSFPIKPENGDVCRVNDEMYTYDNGWHTISERKQETVKIIARPKICTQCGAALNGYKCEYCGTEYETEYSEKTDMIDTATFEDKGREFTSTTFQTGYLTAEHLKADRLCVGKVCI